MIARNGTDHTGSNRWKREMLSRGDVANHGARINVAVFGGIGFWSDGLTLRCRVTVDGNCHVGFDIALRAGAPRPPAPRARRVRPQRRCVWPDGRQAPPVQWAHVPDPLGDRHRSRAGSLRHDADAAPVRREALQPQP